MWCRPSGIFFYGRSFDPHNIELLVEQVEQMRAGSAFAFSAPGPATERLLVMYEKRASIPPPKVVWVEGEVLSCDWEVAPEEWELARGFGEKRRREFLSGRMYARQALRSLGLGCPPIGRNKDGSPEWPEGVVGCISHTRDYCAVVVALKGEVRGIGLDVEDLAAVKEAVRNRTGWIGAGVVERRRRLALLFSAKEAFYKLQFPLIGAWVGFQVVTAMVKEDGRFMIRILKDIGAGFALGEEFQGRYWADDRHVFTLMIGEVIS